MYSKTRPNLYHLKKHPVCAYPGSRTCAFCEYNAAPGSFDGGCRLHDDEYRLKELKRIGLPDCCARMNTCAGCEYNYTPGEQRGLCALYYNRYEREHYVSEMFTAMLDDDEREDEHD